jgi:hypothetical protein
MVGKPLSEEEKDFIMRSLQQKRLIRISQLAKCLNRHRTTIERFLKSKGIRIGLKGRIQSSSIKIPGTIALGYIAAMIDGEGEVGFARYRQSFRGIYPTLSISNTSEELMNWLLQNVGGKVYKRTAIGFRKKPFYEWRIRRSLIFLSCLNQ